MNNKILYIITAAVLFVAGFITAKRYYGMDKTVVIGQNRTITKIVKVTVHDGTVTETTTIDSSTKVKSIKIAGISSKSNFSLLVANDFSTMPKPLYGVSFSREVLGPITLGVFGLTSGTIGVSIGYSF